MNHELHELCNRYAITMAQPVSSVFVAVNFGTASERVR